MVKMKPRESLKNYVSYFQRQMALVYSYNEDVTAAMFISELQVTHSFYKHLVKNDVTKMRDILNRAQKYMQIEEATQAATSRPPKQELEVKKPHFPEEESEPQLHRRLQTTQACARIQQGKYSRVRPRSIQDTYRPCLQHHQRPALG